MTQEALKLALDALETELSIDWTNNDEFNASAEKMHKAIAAIKEALTQPEQEPVIDKSAATRIATSLGWSPQRSESSGKPSAWVRLTDVEIDYLLGSTAGENEETHISFARAIEAKLKELNDHGI
jgi:hypothetical protein